MVTKSGALGGAPTITFGGTTFDCVPDSVDVESDGHFSREAKTGSNGYAGHTDVSNSGKVTADVIDDPDIDWEKEFLKERVTFILENRSATSYTGTNFQLASRGKKKVNDGTRGLTFIGGKLNEIRSK